MTGKPTCRAHSRASSSVATTPSDPGKNRHTVLLHGGARLLFFAHQPDDIRTRSDELDVAALADFGEVGILRQQAVAGMDRVDVGDFGGADDGGNVQITLRKLRRADADGFIGKTHVQRVAVRFAVNGDRANAEFLARADDAQGNLAAIGYQNLLEHRCQALSFQLSASGRSRGWQNNLPES